MYPTLYMFSGMTQLARISGNVRIYQVDVWYIVESARKLDKRVKHSHDFVLTDRTWSHFTQKS